MAAQLGVWKCVLHSPKGWRMGLLFGYANLTRTQAVEQIRMELSELESREYVRWQVDADSVKLGPMPMPTRSK